MGFFDVLGGVSGAIQGAGAIAGALKKPKVDPNTSQTNQYSLDIAKLNAPYTGLITTPSYRFGSGQLVRTNNDFTTGNKALRSQLQSLQAGVRPGYSAMRAAGVNAIRQRASEAAGNLRSNLASRGLLGASFASDAQSRVDKEFLQAEQEFSAAAFKDELEQSQSLIDQQSESLAADATLQLEELGLATNFLQSVGQVALDQAAITKSIQQKALIEKYKIPAAAAKPGAAKPSTKPAAPAAPGQVPFRTRGGSGVPTRPAGAAAAPGKPFKNMSQFA